METFHQNLEQLRTRIPRRHTSENVLEINSIVDEFEDILRQVEAIDENHAKSTAPLFEQLDEVRSKIKLSNSNKASKKVKDSLFDEASGMLKDAVQSLLENL
jgi:archaellum component FlaC